MERVRRAIVRALVEFSNDTYFLVRPCERFNYWFDILLGEFLLVTNFNNFCLVNNQDLCIRRDATYQNMYQMRRSEWRI